MGCGPPISLPPLPEIDRKSNPEIWLMTSWTIWASPQMNSHMTHTYARRQIDRQTGRHRQRHRYYGEVFSVFGLSLLSVEAGISLV